jgi:ANTAR domain
VTAFEIPRVDLWTASLIALVALLVTVGGQRFALLVFVTIPLIATVQHGRRRVAWLALGFTTCVVIAGLENAPVGPTALRLAIAAATIVLPLALVRESQARRREVDELREALAERKLVEQAKGLLMAALGLSEHDAHRRLQLTARERNLRVGDVARRILERRSVLEAAARDRGASKGRRSDRSRQSGRPSR